MNKNIRIQKYVEIYNESLDEYIITNELDCDDYRFSKARNH